MELTKLNALGSAIRAKVEETTKKTIPELTAIVNDELVKPTGIKTITDNGTVDVSQYASALVSVQTSYITVKTIAGALLTCNSQTYQLDSDETEHTFAVGLGEFIVTAEKDEVIKTQTVSIDVAGIYSIFVSFSKLPTGFQEVEYLQSTGEQWIDSGIAPSLDVGIDCNVQVTQFKSGAVLCGTGVSGIESSIYLIQNNVSQLTYYDASGEVISDLLPHHIIFNNSNKQLVVDGVIKKTFSATSFYGGSVPNIFVCTNGQSNVIRSSTWQGKIYSFKIFNNKNETVLREFVPCYRTADKIAGFYDLVSSEFYSNLGTQPFIVGEDV